MFKSNDKENDNRYPERLRTNDEQKVIDENSEDLHQNSELNESHF